MHKLDSQSNTVSLAVKDWLDQQTIKLWLLDQIYAVPPDKLPSDEKLTNKALQGEGPHQSKLCSKVVEY